MKRNIWVLPVVILLLLALISYTVEDRGRSTYLEDKLFSVLIPVQGFFASTGQNIQSLFDAVFFHHEIKAENERLREEFAFYREQALSIKELQEENRRLKEMLDLKEDTDMELVAANVVSRDPGQWFNTVTLNRGIKDGIEQEMAVISPHGLVGMVSSVSDYSCRVILITDPRLPASAMVQRSRDSGITGIIDGYSEEDSRLEFINIPVEADVEKGDLIITSGLGGIFPGNISVGEVEEVAFDRSGMVKRAVVKPSVNFNRLEEVFIVTSE